MVHSMGSEIEVMVQSISHSGVSEEQVTEAKVCCLSLMVHTPPRVNPGMWGSSCCNSATAPSTLCSLQIQAIGQVHVHNQATFNYFDKDGNGVLERHEIQAAFQCANFDCMCAVH
jgi:hypothetical protein